MPEVVTCPKCQRKSRVPDNLMGKRVKCPGCNEVFTAEAAAAPPPPKPQRKADEDDRETYRTEDERRRRRSDDDDEDERVSDRPRRRGRDDEDEDEDRPRRSRARDEDEDDERVTRRRGRYGRDDYDDEDDEDEDEDEGRPRGRRRSGVATDWLRVHRGLGLVLAAIILNIVLTIVLVIGMFAVMGAAFGAMAGPPPAGPGGAAGKIAGGAVTLGAGIIILGILAILGTLAALGLKITGHVFCLASPTAYSSKGLAVATLVLVLTNLGCMVLNWIIAFASLGAGGLNAVANPVGVGGATAAAGVLAQIVSWVGALAGLAAFYVFLFYMRSLAQVTGYDGLARNIIIYVITTVAGSVGLCLVSCAGIAIAAGMAGAAAAQQQQGGGVGNPGAAIAGMGVLGIVCGGVWLLYILGMFIWYIVILVQTRGAVATRLRGA
jgi:hypothetical protein